MPAINCSIFNGDKGPTMEITLPMQGPDDAPIDAIGASKDQLKSVDMVILNIGERMPKPTLEVQVEHRGRTTVLHLSGGLRMETTQQLFECMAENAPRTDSFVLSLAKVRSIDSEVAGALAFFGLGEPGCVLADVPRSIGLLLDAMGLTSKFPCFPDADAACAGTGRIARYSSGEPDPRVEYNEPITPSAPDRPATVSLCLFYEDKHYPAYDSVIARAVGSDKWDSGMGAGQRDMQFYLATREQAQKAKAAVQALGLAGLTSICIDEDER